MWIAVLMLALPLMVRESGAQSLAELARKEAERRKALQDQGVTAKVIEQSKVPTDAGSGRVTLSSPPAVRSGAAPGKAESPAGLASYRSKLQNLGGEISKAEAQVRLIKARLAEERWAPPKAGRIGSRQNAGSSPEQLKWKVRELEARLQQLRDQRLEVYLRGRKAGFLPGELEGKGITP